MIVRPRFVIVVALFVGAFIARPALAADAPPKVQFSRDILPVLSANCFTCHGPDQDARKADLRLDLREQALKSGESGETAIVPGKAAKSEVWRRISSTDREQVMPPPKSQHVLTDAQKETFRRWIDEGAEYQLHWSFVAPQRPVLPATKRSDWARNAIDTFVLARLEREGLPPSPEADRYALARRVAIDLTGLPPTPAAADRFVNDPSPNAYERFVDDILASPAFGERWAFAWLDLARYADSNGYANDNPRSIWKYRDWVIATSNANLPFDEFTLEQLAGDMLEKPSNEQIIATAFHRNTLTNDEGGTNDEEFRTAAVVDRVNTTMQVFMGLTMQCAQCHTHKYDPLSQEEYFKLYAILNQTEDNDRGDNGPLLSTPTPEQERERAELAAEQTKLEAIVAEQEKAPPEKSKGPNEKSKSPPLPTGSLAVRFVRVENLAPDAYLHLAEVEVFAGDKNVARTGTATQVSTGFDGPPQLGIDGNTSGLYANKSVTHTGQANNPWWEVDLKAQQAIEKIVVWNRLDFDTAERLKTWRVVALDEKRNPVFAQRFTETPKPSQSLTLPKTGGELSAAVKTEIERFAKGESVVPVTPEKKRLDELKKKIAGLKGVATPIMKELPEKQQRKTRVIVRGNFLDLGAEVQAGVPAIFPPLPSGVPANRVTLSKWLVDPANPLTARVAVNRHWEQLFGLGLVETSEDFGIRGTQPSHPDLLDWLAVEFRESGWDVKRLLRLIVTSATYRQASQVSPELYQRDPENQLLARGPRFRSSAEVVRDQTLFAAGLLRPKMFGPPVRPERPKQKLSAAFGGATDWETSPGEDKFRRGLYTEWRRTSPYPSMVTFDAPNRTICVVRRPRTNTPLQALTTLNDPVYVEAAQALARRLLAEGGATPETKAAFGFREAVTRPPRPDELTRLVQLYNDVKASYAGNPTGANTMATKPFGPLPAGVDVTDAAAWTVVSNVLLNLDECFAKR